MSKRRYPCSASELLFRILGYVLLFSFGMLCVTPFYLIGISSLASEPSLIRNGFRMIPEEFSLDAYRLVFTNPARIGRAYLHTIFVTLAGTVLSLFLTTLTGYVLSRRDFKWRNGFSFFFFFTTLFSGGLIPWYILCTQALHFKNTYYALILPMAFPIWNMIIAKNFMRGVPYEISESAKMDGAGELTIYFKLYLPISKPLLATLGLFAALAYWNDWTNGLYYLSGNNGQKLYSIQNLLNQMITNIQYLSSGKVAGNIGAEVAKLPATSIRMAIAFIAMLPLFVIYPFLQKYFAEGITLGAVKG